MRFRSLYAVSLILPLWCLVPTASAQKFQFSDQTDVFDYSGGYWVGWDGGVERLVLQRDVRDANSAAVKTVDQSGKVVGIYPVRDFPGSDHADVWAVTPGANGDVILAAIIGYGPASQAPTPVKSLVLTYDSAGTLRSVWDVSPYHHHLLAADAAGNVFALGDADTKDDDYPLLIKYSPQGEVLKEFLPAGSFAAKDGVIGDFSSDHGNSQMYIRGDRLYLYIAVTQEWMVFSLDGVILSRVSLAPAFTQIAVANNSGIARPLQFSTDSSGNILVFVTLQSADKTKPLMVTLARLDGNGAFKKNTTPGPAATQARFLGLRSSGAPVYVENLNKRTIYVDLSRQYDLP
jgi:hypothetical protein